MRKLWIFVAVLALSGCVSSERKEVTRKPPGNFVASESTEPRSAGSKSGSSNASVVAAAVNNPSFPKKGEEASYPVTQGSMILLAEGKQVFVPFQEGPIDNDLTRQIMELSEDLFSKFGGFQGVLAQQKIIITSNDLYDQKPIYQWVVNGKSRYAVEIPESARNRFTTEKFKYIALEILDPLTPGRKFYFHVDPRNIDRPIVINRSDAKVLRVLLGNSDGLSQTISQNLWLNEEPKEIVPKVRVSREINTIPVQIMHVVKMYFSPQNEEFFDPKYEGGGKTDGKSTRYLVLAGRFTGEGIVTGKFEKSDNPAVKDVNEIVQYHFKHEALIVGRGSLKDKPARMEIEFYTIKLGQDEDQLRLAMQQAQFKAQQKLNIFFAQDGKKIKEAADFSFSLNKMDDSSKLALIMRKTLVPKLDDGKFVTPRHITSAILELDLAGGAKVIQ